MSSGGGVHDDQFWPMDYFIECLFSPLRPGIYSQKGLRNQVGGGGGMLQAVTHFYVVPACLLVNLIQYDT